MRENTLNITPDCSLTLYHEFDLVTHHWCSTRSLLENLCKQKWNEVHLVKFVRKEKKISTFRDENRHCDFPTSQTGTLRKTKEEAARRSTTLKPKRVRWRHRLSPSVLILQSLRVASSSAGK